MTARCSWAWYQTLYSAEQNLQYACAQSSNGSVKMSRRQQLMNQGKEDMLVCCIISHVFIGLKFCKVKMSAWMA